MADGSAPFQSTRDRHALGDFRNHLTAQPQQGGTKQPRMSIYYHKNKIVIEVKTNVDSDMNTQARGQIRAELDPPQFFTFLASFARVIDDPNAGAEQIQINRPDFKKTNNGNPVLDTKLLFGRNKDGVLYLALLSWDKARPAVQFPFTLGKFVQMMDNAGNIRSEADASRDIAKGFLRQWEALVPQYMYNRYVAEEFDRNKGGGNQGGGGYGGGGGGYQNRGGGGGYQGGGQGGGYQGNQGGQSSGGGDMGTEQRSNTDRPTSFDDIPF